MGSTQPRVLLLLLLAVPSTLSFSIFSRTNPLQKQLAFLTTTPPPRPGALKLCPPGGSAFFDAFNLICPMKRRRRRSVDGDDNLALLMNKCCEQGCHFQDIFNVCSPF